MESTARGGTPPQERCATTTESARSVLTVSALHEVEGRLFSAGVRDDYRPCRYDESRFAFLDRVRQPYFERERAWYEAAFDRYPRDQHARNDVRSRFRSDDPAQHKPVAWELYQHELWSRLGWNLTPHPATPDGKRRDFLVARPGHDGFYLECAAYLRSEAVLRQERRWGQVREALDHLPTAHHGLMIDRDTIGPQPLPIASLVAAARERLATLHPSERATLIRVREAGWNFTVEAVPAYAGGCIESHGDMMSMDTRLYRPVRSQIVRKAKRASRLDRPLVVALLVDFPYPIVSKPGVVREALFGMPVTVARGDGQHALTTANDGVWAAAGTPKRRGVSALLLTQDLWIGRTLPELHHHPSPHRPFDVQGLPFRTVRYDLRGREDVTDAGADAHDVFGLPPEWPGPEDPFEGINTANPPAAGAWDPHHAAHSAA